jgi:hypothetical protein
LPVGEKGASLSRFWDEALLKADVLDAGHFDSAILVRTQPRVPRRLEIYEERDEDSLLYLRDARFYIPAGLPRAKPFRYGRRRE